MYAFTETQTVNGYTLTISAVLEPGTWAMLGAGLAGLLALALRRRLRGLPQG